MQLLLQGVVKGTVPTRIYSLQALSSILNVALIYDTVDFGNSLKSVEQSNT
jgi:hypothetical protein